LITGKEGLALDTCGSNKETTKEKPEEEFEWFNKCTLMAGSKSHIYVEKSSAWLANFMPETSEDDIEKAKEEASKMATKAAKKIYDIKDDVEAKADKEDIKDKQGYVEEEREELDQLIKDTINE
jgi:hypothetical protein